MGSRWTKRAFEHLSRVRASARDIEHVGKPVTKRNKWRERESEEETERGRDRETETGRERASERERKSKERERERGIARQ